MFGSRLLRLGLAFTATLAGVAVLCGLVLAVSHWTPSGALGPGLYNWAFWVHTALRPVLLPGALLLLTELSPPVSADEGSGLLRAAWIALCLELVSRAVTLPFSQGELSALADVFNVALVLPRLLVAAHVLARVRSMRGVAGVALAFAALVQVIAAWSLLMLRARAFLDIAAQAELLTFVTTFSKSLVDATALAAIAVVAENSAAPSRSMLPVAGLALGLVTPIWLDPLHLSALLMSVGGIWLLVASLRRPGRARGAGERLYGGLAASLFAESMVMSPWLRVMGVDLHLDDTYFVTGIVHLQMTALLLALLALGQRRQPSARHVVWTYLGAALCAVGGHLSSWTMMLLGTRGMPRQYYAYLPEFQTLHRSVALGGLLLAAGLALGTVVAISSWRAAFFAELPARK